MIYLFTGDDIKNKRDSYENFLKSTQSGLETFFVNKNDFNATQIESFYSGAGLFFDKCVVVFYNILENENARDFILEKLQLINESKNIFIFLEGNLNKQIGRAHV
jgi:DNA polymerase III delta subunit